MLGARLLCRLAQMHCGLSNRQQDAADGAMPTSNVMTHGDAWDARDVLFSVL